MPTPALQQALTRIEQAISRAEIALDAANSRVQRDNQHRDAVLGEAMSEIDGLLSTLRESKSGGNGHG